MKNREIKFRIFDKKKNEMFKVDGMLYLKLYDDNSGGIYDNRYGESDMIHCFIEGNILMQFTGLKDKNGKEVYEGDIIITPFGKGIIVWNEDVSSFQYAYNAIGEGTAIGGRMTNTLYKHDEPKYEVIGNVYENEGLLAVAP